MELMMKGIGSWTTVLLVAVISMFCFCACVQPDAKIAKQQALYTAETKGNSTELHIKGKNGTGESTIYIDSNGVITSIKMMADSQSRYIYFNANQSPASMFAYKESAQGSSNANVMNGYQFFFDTTGLFTHLENYDVRNEKIRSWFFHQNQLDSTCSVSGNFISEHDAHLTCGKKVSGLCD